MVTIREQMVNGALDAYANYLSRAYFMDLQEARARVNAIRTEFCAVKPSSTSYEEKMFVLESFEVEKSLRTLFYDLLLYQQIDDTEKNDGE